MMIKSKVLRKAVAEAKNAPGKTGTVVTLVVTSHLPMTSHIGQKALLDGPCKYHFPKSIKIVQRDGNHKIVVSLNKYILLRNQVGNLVVLFINLKTQNDRL